MKTVVLKFGGTSVGSINRIKNVAKIIASYKKKFASDVYLISQDLVNQTKNSDKKITAKTFLENVIFLIFNSIFQSYEFAGTRNRYRLISTTLHLCFSSILKFAFIFRS